MKLHSDDNIPSNEHLIRPLKSESFSNNLRLNGSCPYHLQWYIIINVLGEFKLLDGQTNWINMVKVGYKTKIFSKFVASVRYWVFCVNTILQNCNFIKIRMIRGQSSPEVVHMANIIEEKQYSHVLRKYNFMDIVFDIKCFRDLTEIRFFW